MRRALMLLAALFGLVAVTGFGTTPAEAKRIKLSTIGGAYVAKKVLTSKKKDDDGKDSGSQFADDDDKPAEQSKAVQDARAAAMEAAKAKLAAEKAAEKATTKRTEGEVELASAKMPPNTGVVCLAGCMRPR